jgi:WD40 repeat protein
LFGSRNSPPVAADILILVFDGHYLMQASSWRLTVNLMASPLIGAFLFALTIILPIGAVGESILQSSDKAALAGQPNDILVTTGESASSSDSKTTPAKTNLPTQQIAGPHPVVLPQLGHSEAVTAVAFSPNGRIFASGSGDRTIKVWDVSSGRELRTLRQPDWITTLAFSPDGLTLASGAGDGTIKLWDVASGAELRTLGGDSIGINSVVFSPDGHLLASSADTVKLWDVASGRELRSFGGVAIGSLAFSRDGHTLASVSWAGVVLRVWNLDGKEVRAVGTIGGDPFRVASVTFSQNGQVVAVATSDGLVKLVSVDSGQVLRTFSAHAGAIISTAFSKNDQTLAVSWDDGIVLWDVSTGQELRSIVQKAENVGSITFSPNGDLLASGSDRTTKLWDVATGQERRRLGAKAREVDAAVFSRSGHTLAWISPIRSVKIPSMDIQLLDFARGDGLRTLTVDAKNLMSIAFAPDGQTIAAGDIDHTVEILNASTGKIIRKLSGHSEVVSSVAVSPDGRLVASGSWDETVKLWDARSGRELRTLKGHTNKVRSVAFSPDGQSLASGGDDDTIRLWDVRSGREIRKLDGNLLWVFSVAFSPDGKALVSGEGGIGGVAKIWDVATGQLLHVLNGHSEKVSSVAFSPDGGVVASASWDHTIKLWDTYSGRELLTLTGHDDAVDSLTFSADGRVLASGGFDRMVKLWEVSSGKELASVIAFVDGSSIAITPQGYYDYSSIAAEENLNVRVGDEVFGIGQYRDQFYRPGLIKFALAGVSIDSLPSLHDVGVAPRVEFLNLPSSTDNKELTVRIKTIDNGGGTGKVRLLVNGVARVEAAGPRGSPQKDAGNVGTYVLPLDRGDNKIEAVVYAGDNVMQSNAATADVHAAYANTAPVFHAVVVGINKFGGTQSTVAPLRLAVADAQLVGDTLTRYAVPLFSRIDVKTLTNFGDSSRDNIRRTLESMQQSVAANDVFVFYVASHGVVADGNYYLITSNVNSWSSKELRDQALDQNALIELLANIPATHKLIIFDTCQSGGIVSDLETAMRLRGMSQRTALTVASRDLGLTVMAATTDEQQANEGYKDHGLFTFVVNEGLRGKGGTDSDGDVTTQKLTGFINSTVSDLALQEFKKPQDPLTAPYGNFKLTRPR